jgi:hypothetical protein
MNPLNRMKMDNINWNKVTFDIPCPSSHIIWALTFWDQLVIIPPNVKI